MSLDRKKKEMSLEWFYQDFVAKARVDYSSPEIQDMSNALKELLDRCVKDGLEFRCDEDQRSKKFNVLSIQPCGSMAEKTALWKSSRVNGKERQFLEFDYIAELDTRETDINIELAKCGGSCYMYVGQDTENAIDSFFFPKNFRSALYSNIKALCKCKSKKALDCEKCIVKKQTGYLQVVKTSKLKKIVDGEKCSLVFYWTSLSNCLFAPNIDTLKLTELIKRLVIRVDFVPGFRVDGDMKFILIKTPSMCKDCFRSNSIVSHCMEEMKALDSVSEKHKQCYVIIKFLYGQLSYWTEADVYLKSYYAKLAFLSHCQTCKNGEEDFISCIDDIFKSLKKAYKLGTLLQPEFHAQKYILINKEELPSFRLLLKCLEDIYSEISRYRQSNKQCEGIIKKTIKTMLDAQLLISTDSQKIPVRGDVLLLEKFASILCDKRLNNSAFALRNTKMVEVPRNKSLHKEYLTWIKKPSREVSFVESSIMHKLWNTNPEDINESVIRKRVKRIQRSIKKFFRRPRLPTDSQSCLKMSADDRDKTIQDLGSGVLSNDNGGGFFSLFTEDLQINWSGFTEPQYKIIKAKIQRLRNQRLVLRVRIVLRRRTYRRGRVVIVRNRCCARWSPIIYEYEPGVYVIYDRKQLIAEYEPGVYVIYDRKQLIAECL